MNISLINHNKFSLFKGLFKIFVIMTERAGEC